MAASDVLNEAVQHHQAGRLKMAEQLYRQIVAGDPNDPQAWQLLGVIGYQQGKLPEALECLEKALRIRPNYPDAHYNLANVLKQQGKAAEAIPHYRRFLEVVPDHVEALNNLGNSLQQQGEPVEAVACYRKALALRPNAADAHSNLGYALQALGRVDEAVACYDQALALRPDHALAHCNRGLALLTRGDWSPGWPEYEWRWRTKDISPRAFDQPQWRGEPLNGKTILLHAEQGLGDTIQFIRYAPLVKQRGATRVVLECQPALLGLLEGASGVDRLVARNAELPAFDVHASLLSLPGIFNTTPETVPARIPYLRPNPLVRERWRAKLESLDGFKVGLHWQGNPAYRLDRERSIRLRSFAPLAEVPGVRLVSLQKGNPGPVTEIKGHFSVTHLGELDREAPFQDTAAVMTLLDLVVVVDAAPAHLAGALGVPTWLVLSTAPSWRWLLGRSDTPWYPTMRLFRQKERGNWDGAIRELAHALRDVATSGRPTA